MMNICTYVRALFPCLLFVFGLASAQSMAETNPRFYAVEVSATIQAAPPQINLEWSDDNSASSYNIYRKAPSATSWTLVTSLPGSGTSWSDQNVSTGASYEYAITKSTSAGYQGTGYVLAGINAPMTENRGKLVLIVDSTHAAALATELTPLQQDLLGDGWTVIRHDVPRTATPPTVKNLIRNAYNADRSNVKSVFLFGHVAVPYSGNFNPDAHPDHKGAWAADTYYGDMDGAWTDSSVNNTGAHKPWNHNSPGDGKFDQSDLPSDLELAVGRVDFYNMTCFSNKAWSRSELDLLRAYLDKDHAFRHGRIVVPGRGLVCDNFGESGGEAFASTGWRSFAPFFGAENNVQVGYGQYFNTLRDEGYLWSYGTGGGSWYTCNGIGSSDDFANTEIKTVFTSFLGSYFGDWDNESAFLRAALGSGWTLATAWGGRPHWFFHRMGLGEPIGTSAILSQNNRYGGLYAAQNWGTHQVHVTLLGDPTLRMHPVLPPSNVSATAGNGVTLTWSPSTDSSIQGYAVYRANSANGPFTRIGGSALTSNLYFTDPSGASSSVYMVRAVKLEQSGSGTYLNPSQGIIATVGGTSEPEPTPTPTPTPTAPSAPSKLSGSALSTSQIRLQWTDNSSNESGFRILRKQGQYGSYTTLTVGVNTSSYTDNGLATGTQYYYSVYAYNSVGNSAATGVLGVTTQSDSAPAPTPTPTPAGENTAVFIKSDSATSGSWKGVYGGEGAAAPYSDFLTPGDVEFTAAGINSWSWAYPTASTVGLQKRSSSERFATCWYSPTEMSFDLKLEGTATHRVSFYFSDFDALGRQQTVQIIDAASGQVLDTRNISNFSKGLYLTWDLKGDIRVKVSRVAGANAVVSGIFFDEGSSSAPTPTPTPTPGPTPAPVPGPNAVRFLAANTTMGGAWIGSFGSEGRQVIGDSARLPAYTTISTSGTTEHVWNWSNTDSAALQRTSTGDRVAACWYSSSSFSVRVNISDGRTHKVSFYCLDWDVANRAQKVEVLDAATGAVLHSTSVSNFQEGTYLSYDVKGSVIFRFNRTAGANAVVSGMFFDPASAAL